MTDHNPNQDSPRTSDNISIGRREFGRLSIATAGALTLPTNATASVTAPALTDRYQYVVNHTPADYEVQTPSSSQTNPDLVHSIGWVLNHDEPPTPPSQPTLS